MTREPRDATDPGRSARERSRDRAAIVESVLAEIDPDLDEHAYPVSSHDLVAEYRSTEFDLPGETESFADALDRLAESHDEFADAEEARTTLTAELRRDERFDETFTDDPVDGGRVATEPEPDAGAE